MMRLGFAVFQRGFLCDFSSPFGFKITRHRPRQIAAIALEAVQVDARADQLPHDRLLRLKDYLESEDQP